jgi:very-short-patch-repair endonuclease
MKSKNPTMSDLERHLATQIRMFGLPEPETQYELSDKRKFRWDFAWPERLLLVEVNGGTWTQGAHGRGTGIRRDYEKANFAVLHGWRQLSFTSDQIEDDTAILTLRNFFERGKP